VPKKALYATRNVFSGLRQGKMTKRLILLLASLIPNMQMAPGNASHIPCTKRELFQAQHVVAWSDSSAPGVFFYESGLAIDADGSPHAYHPNDRLGLDSLSHAGHRGNWWALVTDTEKKNGTPVVQGAADPAPGYFVSTTALYDRANTNPRDPRRYVDAEKIPYVVLHPKALHHAKLGDFATVVNLKNRKISPAIVADVSAPNLPVGEGSIALAEALAIDSSARRGGQDGNVVFVIYPGSGNGKPRELRVILANAKRLFEAWGGIAKLDACLVSGTRGPVNPN
jgi:hypothetical protein